MTEVGPADRSRLLRSKHDECRSIVNSRKRKLRQLFTVATAVDDLPNHDFSNPDAPPATSAENQFLQTCDVLQGRNFNELNIPTRPKLRYDVLKQTLESSGLFATENASPAAEKSSGDAQIRSVLTPPADQRSANENGGNEVAIQGLTQLQVAPASVASPKVASDLSSSFAKGVRGGKPTNRAGGLPALQAPAASPSSAQASLGLSQDPLHVSGKEVDSYHEAVLPEKSPSTTQASPRASSREEGVRFSVQEGAGKSLSKGRVPQPLAHHAGDGQSGEAGSIGIKPSSEPSRIQEVFSSPGSTTQTATTPAIHDASTDTSPDNEGPQYIERGETKDDATPEVDSGPAEEPLDRQSTEARPAGGLDDATVQLLQESMETGADKPGTVPQQPETVPPLGGHAQQIDSRADGATTTEHQSSLKQPSSATQDVQTNGSTLAARVDASSKEIPDSQGSSPADQMDQDQPTESNDTTATTKATPHQTDSSGARHSHTAIKPPQSTGSGREETTQDSERAVTRVSSGAMRQKSVSEILGETPRPVPSTEKGIAGDAAHTQLTPVTATPRSPPPRTKGFPGRRKEKPKKHASTVVFGKQPKRSSDTSVVQSQQSKSFLPTDDYFTPLFVQGFTQTSKWMKPIEVILNQAHKTVSTPDAFVALQDNQACRVLRRVYHLQQNDKWSLRQPKRCPEPTRPESHWDVLLHEMKWMRTDFREERKWKMAVARNLAAACADWVASNIEERKLLQVSVSIPPTARQANANLCMIESAQGGPESQPTPELMPSGDLEPSEQGDEPRDDIFETVAPSAIFALQDDDVVFGLQQSPTADQLLSELPMYGMPLKVPSFDFTGPEVDPDAHWRRPAVPLSKYVEGQMKLVSEGPPRKRSRYQYEQEDDDEDERVIFGGQSPGRAKLPPQDPSVALFNPDMKPIRDRLHAGHQFRPPAEYQMPMQSFYESRSPSQWTAAEDDELRALVREYSYNWSLISSMLTSKSLFAAGAERRTPWECFERWINLEGLPVDMAKTQYFKAYQNRIDAAQRVILQQNQLAQQQAAGANGAVTPITRRRPSTPLRVERRRNQKHLTLIDAMRKLAKKRETATQKQQHASQMAAMRKANEAAQPRGPIKTPRDYSLMRWERDQQLAEKVAQYHQRQETQRRMVMQARAQGQVANQIAPTPGAAQVPANGAAAPNPNAPRANIPNQLAVPGQNRPRMPMQVPPNGMGAIPAQMGGLVPPMAMPQAQMQAAIQGQHRMAVPNPQNDVQVMMQARRISEQQRQAVQQLQAQQQAHQVTHLQQANAGTQSHSPPNMRANVNGVNSVPSTVNGVVNGVHGINGMNSVNGATGVNGINGVNAVNTVNGVNGINSQSFIANAQAMMAQLTATGGNNAMASPSAGGLHMPNGPAGSPRPPGAQPQISAGIASQLNVLESQFRQKNPNLTPEQARQMATEHLTRLIMVQRQNMSQSAMNAAAGGTAGSPTMPNGLAATTSPHQYAALLRQQQQQQQQQAAAAAAAQAGMASQHQRQSSGSATPSVSK